MFMYESGINIKLMLMGLQQCPDLNYSLFKLLIGNYLQQRAFYTICFSGCL